MGRLRIATTRAQAAARRTELPGGGTDNVYSSLSYTLTSDVENLILTGAGNLNGVGNTGDNTILGTSGNNTMLGGLGDDRLFGYNGNDTLNGGLGNDTLNGNPGADILNGGDGTFASQQTYPVGQRPWSVALRDVTGGRAKSRRA